MSLDRLARDGFDQFCKDQKARLERKLSRMSRTARSVLSGEQKMTKADLERHGAVEAHGITSHYSGEQRHGQP